MSPFTAAKPSPPTRSGRSGVSFGAGTASISSTSGSGRANENFNAYAVNPADKPASGADVPTARNLTDLKGVRVAIYSIPRTDPDILYID